MLFHMDTFLTILIDILAWFFIHMGVSYLMAHKSRYCFNPEGWLYRQRSWECNSSLYYKWFHVHQWKHILPDGADLFKFGFQKKHLTYALDSFLVWFYLLCMELLVGGHCDGNLRLCC
jgi:glycosyl-4,4'-diaponeurosporenoate acyltransferase